MLQIFFTIEKDVNARFSHSNLIELCIVCFFYLNVECKIIFLQKCIFCDYQFLQMSL